MTRQAFICDAIRTPFGRYGGALAWGGPAAMGGRNTAARCAPTIWAQYRSRR
jgi:hypothetical protein